MRYHHMSVVVVSALNDACKLRHDDSWPDSG